jgi:hypothetical protein
VTRTDALRYIDRGFTEEDEELPYGKTGWYHPNNGESYRSLFLQLVDDHGLNPMTAVDILESAYKVAEDEVREC